MPRPRAVALVLLFAVVAAGCARPYRGPKTLAAIGAGVLLGGSGVWLAGERSDRSAVTTAGAITTAVGAAVIVGAAGWLAASIACRVDPDCPGGEECRELPAPPGGVPYRQCVRR